MSFRSTSHAVRRNISLAPTSDIGRGGPATTARRQRRHRESPPRASRGHRPDRDRVASITIAPPAARRAGDRDRSIARSSRPVDGSSKARDAGRARGSARGRAGACREKPDRFVGASPRPADSVPCRPARADRDRRACEEDQILPGGEPGRGGFAEQAVRNRARAQPACRLVAVADLASTARPASRAS
jgi:hypothetical protein